MMEVSKHHATEKMAVASLEPGDLFEICDGDGTLFIRTDQGKQDGPVLKHLVVSLSGHVTHMDTDTVVTKFDGNLEAWPAFDQGEPEGATAT